MGTLSTYDIAQVLYIKQINRVYNQVKIIISGSYASLNLQLKSWINNFGTTN